MSSTTNNMYNESSRKRTTMTIPSRYESQVSRLLADLSMADTSEESSDEECNESDIVSNTIECEVSAILAHKVDDDDEFVFKLKFKGYEGSEWVKDSNTNCEDLIVKYLHGLEIPIPICYCVCRVSTTDQSRPGHVSLGAQASLLKRKAIANYGYTTRIKVIEISASAYKGIPSKLYEVAQWANSDDSVFIYRVDRLSRNIIKYLAFIEEMNDHGVDIYAVDEDLWYRTKRIEFIQAILDGQKESAAISKRVRLSIQARRERGDEHFGSCKYGKHLVREFGNPDDRLVIRDNESEMAIIKLITQARADGSTTNMIVKQLVTGGVTKRGKVWNAGMVNRIAPAPKRRMYGYTHRLPF